MDVGLREKFPEIVSGIANGILSATLVAYAALAVAYAFGVFKVVIP